ncbi:DUF4907 domain-containing protein [Galbibacter orientalis]|uniref:DUF4907 domain-containing protein n=1 Tax=Galbibacter orientalis TaxID=453852 RepID=UPI0005924CE7|nr:DUF4907 domain-containing protein [Galbibacter orientalis]
MRLNKTKSYLLIISSLVLLSAFWIFKKDELLSAKVIKVNNGYGYEVLYKENVIIKQEYIPAISYRKVFVSEADAWKVATLVKYKLKQREKPIIAIKDLDSLDVNINK